MPASALPSAQGHKPPKNKRMDVVKAEAHFGQIKSHREAAYLRTPTCDWPIDVILTVTCHGQLDVNICLIHGMLYPGYAAYITSTIQQESLPRNSLKPWQLLHIKISLCQVPVCCNCKSLGCKECQNPSVRICSWCNIQPWEGDPFLSGATMGTEIRPNNN